MYLSQGTAEDCIAEVVLFCKPGEFFTLEDSQFAPCSQENYNTGCYRCKALT